jgi:hypothetical protein
MAFKLSHCIGITTPDLTALVTTYGERFGLQSDHTPDGFAIFADPLILYLDPGPRQPPILELVTDSIDQARPLLRAFGCQELAWNGLGKLNLVTDPFGINWNIYQAVPENRWPKLLAQPSVILPKVALHLHETAKAAQFYSDLLAENALKTLSGWIIDSNQIRLVIEPGLPHGPALYIDLDTLPDPTSFLELVNNKSTHTDEFGITWKLNNRPAPAKAIINPKP